MTMHPRAATILSTLALILSLGCAGGGGSGGSGVKNSGSDVITAAELADPSLVGATVLDAVQRLRPRFLNQRSNGLGGATGTLLASLNGMDLLPSTELARITVGEVTEIRYLSASDAAQRFGTRGTMGPVLVVTLKRR